MIFKELGLGALALGMALTVAAPVTVSAQNQGNSSQGNDNKEARREYKRIRREQEKRRRELFKTLEQNYWRNASGYGIGPGFVDGFYDQFGRYQPVSTMDGYYDSIGYFHPWGGIGHN